MELIGRSLPPLSFFTEEMRIIISSASLSEHLAQASTTLLYFSPWVIRPSLYCCSYSFASAEVDSMMAGLVSGTTMSSLPNDMPARNASRKPSAMIRSQKITVSFCPQLR